MGRGLCPSMIEHAHVANETLTAHRSLFRDDCVADAAYKLRFPELLDASARVPRTPERASADLGGEE